MLVPHTWPGAVTVYADSALFIGLASVFSMLSGTVGVALLAGNGLREMLNYDLASGLHAMLHVGAARVIVWLLLAVLVVMLPQLAQLVTEAGVVRMRFLRHRDGRALVRALLLALIYPALVLAWCQAITVLVRPIYTWSGASPSAETIRNVQAWWPWLVWAAACAALLRGTLEGLVAPRLRHAGPEAGLEGVHQLAAPATSSLWHRVPEGLRVTVAVAGMILLLAGMFERLTDAVTAGLALGLLAMLGRGLCGWLTDSWEWQVSRVPGAVRVALALGSGYALASLAVQRAWGASVVHSMLIGTIFTLTLFIVLFPGTGTDPTLPRRRP